MGMLCFGDREPGFVSENVERVATFFEGTPIFQRKITSFGAIFSNISNKAGAHMGHPQKKHDYSTVTANDLTKTDGEPTGESGKVKSEPISSTFFNN